MLPQLKEIFNCSPVNSSGCSNPVTRVSGATNFASLGDFLSGILSVVFYIAAFLAFYWLVWGAMQYIIARGKKEDLAKARSRIQWALIGVVVVFLSYILARFASNILPLKSGTVLPF